MWRLVKNHLNFNIFLPSVLYIAISVWHKVGCTEYWQRNKQFEHVIIDVSRLTATNELANHQCLTTTMTTMMMTEKKAFVLSNCSFSQSTSISLFAVIIRLVTIFFFSHIIKIVLFAKNANCLSFKPKKKREKSWKWVSFVLNLLQMHLMPECNQSHSKCAKAVKEEISNIYWIHERKWRVFFFFIVISFVVIVTAIVVILLFDIVLFTRWCFMKYVIIITAIIIVFTNKIAMTMINFA